MFGGTSWSRATWRGKQKVAQSTVGRARREGPRLKPSEHIQVAVDPAVVRAGRPIQPIWPLEMPRLRRLRGRHVPGVTRRIPAVEIVAGAILGVIAGFVWGLLRWKFGEVLAGMFFGTLFGLLIGWLIATFTGATGTLSVRTVLVNMLHIVWVLTVVACFVGIIGLLAALAGAAYGPASRE